MDSSHGIIKKDRPGLVLLNGGATFSKIKIVQYNKRSRKVRASMPPKDKVESTIHAQGTEISVLSSMNDEDFISLTDLARYRNPSAPKDVVKNWMRIRNTIEFLGLWEELNNPNF